MAYLEGFNANDVDPNEPMQPVPAGTYMAMIIDQKDKDGRRVDDRQPSKSGNGDLAHFVFEILEGQYKGRKVHERLNLWNNNETARKIAWGDMSAICRAVGVMTPNDTSDLHNIPLEIIVGVTNPNAEGKQYNEINGYQKRGASGGGAAAPVTAPTTPTPDAPATNSGKPSWMGA
jgi:hypothetical protein